MYTELYINNRIADMRLSDSISLYTEFQDPSELVRKRITYSYNIKLPVTVRNGGIFGFTSAVDVKDKFNRIYDAQLYCDGLCILDGKLIVNKIDSENYECNLYVPERQELKDILGDRTLREIVEHNKYLNDWDDITKINNYVGGIELYESQYPPLEQRDNHICFPYVLYNYPYNKPETGLSRYEQTLNYGDSTFNLNNVFPAFNVLSVLRDIFRTENYNLQGNVFSDPRFNGLFHTYSSTFEEYKQFKDTPYYLSFDCSYILRGWSSKKNRMNTSSSAEVAEDGSFRFGVDAPLYSDNTKLSNINDKYEMLQTSNDAEYGNDLKTIIVPVSGWYQFHCNGTIELPDIQRYDSGDGVVVTVTGTNSLDDSTKFAHSAYEFHIMRGNVKENPRYWSYNWCLPLVPADYFDSEVSPSVYWNNRNEELIGGFSSITEKVGVKILSGNDTRKFGKNGKTTLVKDLSGLDTSNFICGARFGNQLLAKGNVCRTEYREDPKNAMMGLLDVSKTLDIIESESDRNSASYAKISENIPYFAFTGGLFDKTYGRNTAQILVREDSYSNFEGYNLLTMTNGSTSTTYGWDTTTNYSARTFPGQTNSNAYVDSSKDKGTFDINTCVWLEEGDIIYPELISAYNHQQDECSWYEAGCKCGGRKHFYKRGLTNVKCDFSFSMGIVSTDENWTPTNEDPIPTENEIKEPKLTNVNKMLPNVKCNDYVNKFLDTFNLRLTQINDNTFSIDTQGDTSLIMNTVDIDPYCKPEDAKFSKITYPSTIKLDWKINKEEEGYEHNNDSPYNEDIDMPYSQPKYEGNLEWTDPTNTSKTVKKKESLWSYNWFKTIRTTDGYEFPAPIICYSRQWQEGWTYEMAQAEKLKTDFTMRFFYIYNRKDANGVPLRNWIQINGDRTFRLLIADNYIYGYSVGDTGLSETKAMMIDYNNSVENTRMNVDKTITDLFFNLKPQRSYNAEIELYLPISEYVKIKENTQIMFNNGIWRVESIDGVSTSEDEKAKLKLLSS